MALPQKVNVKAAIKARLAGQTYSQIAAAQGVDTSRIFRHIKPLMSAFPHADQLHEYQEKQAEVFDAVATGIVSSISNQDLEKATLQQKVTSIGILTDKARLIRGQSTNNTMSVLLTRHVRDTPPEPAVIPITDDDI